MMTDNSTCSILYIIPNLSIGGTETTLVNLVNSLDPDVYDIHLCTISGDNPLRSNLNKNIKYYNIKTDKKVSISTTIRLTRLINAISPDILQTFLRYGNIISPIPKLINNDISVITGIRTVPTSLPIWKDYPERVGLSFSDYVVSNSYSGKKHAEQRGISSKKIEVIPNGRDMSSFKNANPAKDIQLLRSNPDTQIVGTVGRLIKRKGHQDLLTAWKGIIREYENAQLVIVGGGPEYEALEQRAVELGISSSVHLLGTRTDVPAVLAAVDLFVFPSHFEGLPGAVIEAMASGLPIVATDVDGNSELIDNGVSGILLPKKNVKKLQDEVIKLLYNQSLCEQYGQEAYKKAIKEYSNKRVVNKFTQLYSKI